MNIIAIIISALTILPKRYRKWFWLGGTAIVLILVVWVFLPDNDQGWQRYSLTDEMAGFNAERALADEENAATIYNKLIEGYDWQDNQIEPTFLSGDDERNTYRGFWKTSDYPKLAKWIEQQDGLIGTILEVSKKPRCCFPSNLALHDKASTNMYRAMRSWYRLLIWSANNDVGGGDIDSAIAKYQACLQIGNHQFQQPQTTFFLGGIGCHKRIFTRLNNLIISQDMNKSHLDKVEKIVSSISVDLEKLRPGIVECESIQTKQFLLFEYEINSKGKARLCRNASQVFMDEIKESFDLPFEWPVQSYWERKFSKASTIFKWFYVPSTPEKAAKIIDELFDKYYEMAESDFAPDAEDDLFSFSNIKLNYKFMKQMNVDMIMNNSFILDEMCIENMSMRNASVLLIGLKKYHNEHGCWPENLEQIEDFIGAEYFYDPENGDEFIYKQIDGEFTLYSKGMNGVDDSGEKVSRMRREPGEPDDIVFWPPSSR